MEADDDRLRCLGEQHVALGDRSHAAVNHLHCHLVGRELRERVGESLGRATLIGLDDDVERLDITLFDLPGEILQRQAPRGTPVHRFTVEALALLRDLARRLGVPHHREVIAGLRDTIEAQDLDGHGRTRLFHPLPTLVEHRAHAAGEVPADEVGPDLQGPVLDEDRRNRTLTRVQRAFDHRPSGIAIRIGLLVEQLGLEQDLLEQLLDTLPRFGGDG